MFIEDKKKSNQSERKYRILSKKIGLKNNQEYIFNSSNNSNNITNSPTNCNNSEEKTKIRQPVMKHSSLNAYCKANKLLSNNSINRSINQSEKENNYN